MDNKGLLIMDTLTVFWKKSIDEKTRTKHIYGAGSSGASSSGSGASVGLSVGLSVGNSVGNSDLFEQKKMLCQLPSASV